VKIQGIAFLATAAFMGVIGAVYWFTSYEPTGTMLLALAAVLALIPGAFLTWKAVRSEPGPSDREDAEPDEAAGTIGSFPESSVWPVVLAAGTALAVVGLVFGLWAGVPGAVIVVVAFVGAVLESRGEHLDGRQASVTGGRAASDPAAPGPAVSRPAAPGPAAPGPADSSTAT
jgi:hypothetical protein